MLRCCMPTIEALFNLHNARSAAFENHKVGDVAFVTNGLRGSGVLGFVKPMRRDRVFDFVGLAVSAFCEATVQIPPFIARGNGGSGLVVLEPKEPMAAPQIAYVAAWMNTTLRRRFSWYRQASADRIRRLKVPDPKTSAVRFDPKRLLPAISAPSRPKVRLDFRPFCLDDIYELVPGDHHNAGTLPRGEIPLVSCGSADNGIWGRVDVPDDTVYEHKLTIAFNGAVLTAKYHPYRFAAKDDVAVCFPRKALRASSQFFIRVMLDREKWRYSYYRKCYMEKLRKFEIPLPERRNAIDEDAIEALVASTPYWGFVKTAMTPA